MIRLTLLDGSPFEIPREEALELLPYQGVFASPMLKSPFEGLLVHRGKLVPVLGPLPAEAAPGAPVEDRPWILLMKGCAQAVRGLPEFVEEGNVVPLPTLEERGLPADLEDVLKSA
jgi:hypothetical protein